VLAAGGVDTGGVWAPLGLALSSSG
jgi:hypothetical protein